MQLRFATIPPGAAIVWPNGSIGVQRMKRARSMLPTGRPRQPYVRPPGTRRGTDRNHPGVTAVTPGRRTHPYAMMPMTLSESAAEPTSSTGAATASRGSGKDVVIDDGCVPGCVGRRGHRGRPEAVPPVRRIQSMFARDLIEPSDEQPHDPSLSSIIWIENICWWTS